MARSRKRAHSGSDEEEDEDFETVASGRGPTRRAPKRQAAAGVAHAVRSVAQTEAQSGSDEDYRDHPGLREEMSGDERSSMLAKKSGTSTKINNKRRIDSDDDSDAEASGSPPANDGSGTQAAQKLKIRLPATNASKSRKVLKDEKSATRSTAPEGSSAKKPSLPKRPSQAASTQTATPSLIKKPSARPTEANLSSSRDLDLTNPATMMSLFKTTATTSSVTKEQQPGVHEALRAEAKRIREAEAKTTFDLMAPSEKIRAFESCLEGMGVWPLPQVLLHPLSTTTGHVPNAPPPNASQQAAQ